MSCSRLDRLGTPLGGFEGDMRYLAIDEAWPVHGGHYPNCNPKPFGSTTVELQTKAFRLYYIRIQLPKLTSANPALAAAIVVAS